MEKLTLSIRDKEKVNWAKSFAKQNNTNVSRLFETFLESIMTFEQKKVVLSQDLQNLRQPGSRPSQKEIENHFSHLS
ncbi:MAG: DUF6364 family protein [Cyclobacteriaceae bacterium]